MAIAYDTQTIGANSTTPVSHTCTGSNRLLIVGVLIGDTTTTVSTLTYNSVSLAQANRRTSTNMGVELWYLANPASGANNIALTLSAAQDYKIFALSLTGVHQASPLDANNTGTGSTDPSVSVTTVADNSWVVDIVASFGSDLVVGAGQTQRINTTWLGGDLYGSASTEGPKTPAGAVTMSWTQTDSEWVSCAASFAPATASSIKTVDNLAIASVKTVNGLARASVKTVNGLA